MISANLRRLENYKFLIEKTGNQSFVASVVANKHDDDLGALYYVVAVILIYGFSIVLMIASHIRKNKVDRKLTNYLKEMANVRKRERQIQLFNAAARASLAHIMTKEEQIEATERYSRRFNFRFMPERNGSQSSETADDTDIEQKLISPGSSRNSCHFISEIPSNKSSAPRKPSRIRFSSPLAQLDKDSIAHDSIRETEQESKETDRLLSYENNENTDVDCSDTFCPEEEEENNDGDDEQEEEEGLDEEEGRDEDEEDAETDQGEELPWVTKEDCIENCDRTSQDSSDDEDSVFDSDECIHSNTEDEANQKKDNSQLQLISCL